MRFRGISLAQQLKRIASGQLATRWRLPAGRSGWPHLVSATSRVESRGESPRDRRVQRLETVLLVAREPLTTRKLSALANLADGTEARTLVRRLNELYDRYGRAFRIEEVAGGFQLLTRPRYGAWLRRLTHIPQTSRLTAPALETLSVIAYRQPVGRAEIEAIRGVSCGEILRQLMERDLVKISGRGEDLGRPYLYTTTRRFLQMFGLPNLEKLPQAGLPRNAAASPPGRSQQPVTTDDRQVEESTVSVITPVRWSEIEEEKKRLASEPLPCQSVDEDEDFEEETDDLDDDEDDDLEDDEFDDDDDEDEDDEFDDDEVDDEFEDDFEDEEDEDWEEVEDDDEEDLDDDDDEGWDDDEEEEEEDWE